MRYKCESNENLGYPLPVRYNSLYFSLISASFQFVSSQVSAESGPVSLGQHVCIAGIMVNMYSVKLSNGDIQCMAAH